MSTKVKKRGSTTISRKHQITIPADALRQAGLGVGDRVKATAEGPGKVLLERQEGPIERFGGALTGFYPPDHVDDLREEWD